MEQMTISFNVQSNFYDQLTTLAMGALTQSMTKACSL